MKSSSFLPTSPTTAFLEQLYAVINMKRKWHPWQSEIRICYFHFQERRKSLVTCGKIRERIMILEEVDYTHHRNNVEKMCVLWNVLKNRRKMKLGLNLEVGYVWSENVKNSVWYQRYQNLSHHPVLYSKPVKSVWQKRITDFLQYLMAFTWHGGQLGPQDANSCLVCFLSQ